jgi:hypothetical protein
MRLIEHLFEPKRLVLAWQSLDPAHRRRYAVGELTPERFRYLMDTEDFSEARKRGFAGYPAFRLHARSYENDPLRPFLRRIPPRSRADFPNFLRSIGLRPGTEISDFALLGYSEARDISDGFSLVNPLDEVTGPVEFVTEVAGYRYEGRDKGPVPQDQELTLVREQHNVHDPAAVRIDGPTGKALGYVNRLQAQAFGRFLDTSSARAWTFRRNGTEAHPRLFILVAVSAPNRIAQVAA